MTRLERKAKMARVGIECGRIVFFAVCGILAGCNTNKSVAGGTATQMVTTTEASPAARAANYDARIGVAVATGARACVAIHNANLASGTAVSLIVPSTPQTFRQAEIGSLASSPCPISKEVDSSVSSYDIHLTGAPMQKLVPMIAVAGPSISLSMLNGGVQADLDQNGTAETFRSCGAADGVHLTVWQGVPLTGLLVWHGFYYEPSGAGLGPACAPKEISGV